MIGHYYHHEFYISNQFCSIHSGTDGLLDCMTKIADFLTALEAQTFPGCIFGLTACAPFRGAAAGQTDLAVAELS